MSTETLSIRPAILLTGAPAVGKTTIVQKVIAQFADAAGGFYTRAVVVGGDRANFEIVALSGETALLATKATTPPFAREAPFDEFRVNLDAIEVTALGAIERAMATKKLLVVDEIGPMEIASPPFQAAMMTLLNKPQVLVFGTIVARPYRFADAVKQHPRVQVVEVTMTNRAGLPEQLIETLRRYL